jgi:hypothetical protein
LTATNITSIGFTSTDATITGTLTATNITSIGFTSTDATITGTLTATNITATVITATLSITSYGPISTVVTTATSLPSAVTAGIGARAFITDASTTTFNEAVVGSGVYKMPVFSDGTGWFIG